MNVDGNRLKLSMSVSAFPASTLNSEKLLESDKESSETRHDDVVRRKNHEISVDDADIDINCTKCRFVRIQGIQFVGELDAL